METIACNTAMVMFLMDIGRTYIGHPGVFFENKPQKFDAVQFLCSTFGNPGGTNFTTR